MSFLIYALVGATPPEGGFKAQLMSPDLALTFATWITFILLIVLLKKFGWGPLTKALDEREAKIADDVRRAENARREAEEILSTYNRKLSEAGAEADRLINEARARAEEVGARMSDEARKTADEIIIKAKASIDSERQKAVAELREIVADAATGLAGRIIGEELDSTRHARLVDEAVAAIPARR